MPLYDYRCAKCGHVVEVRHSFGERFSGTCAECGGELQRVFNPAPIHFKGSGFYATDSRRKAAEPAKSETKSETKTEDAAKKSDESKPSEKKSDAKPSGSESAA
jgi:putative FmdB family regulatory protein